MIELYDLIIPFRIKPYNGFIFLCGGQISSTSSPPASLRHAIQTALTQNVKLSERIRIAEDYKDWTSGSLYTDLLEFERHIAELSSVIVLILESPGSLVELGLFSAIDEYQDKLLVVTESKYYRSNSFIELGPIAFLEGKKNNHTEYHNWKIKDFNDEILDANKMFEAASLIEDSITKRLLRKSYKTFSFNIWLHRALFICDILNLYSALTLREISSQLNRYCSNIKESEIKQTLRALEILGLIDPQPKGDQIFYVGNNPDLFVEYENVTTHNHDAFRIDQLTHYKQNERRRFLAIQEVRRI
jgi:hypothetical protein